MGRPCICCAQASSSSSSSVSSSSDEPSSSSSVSASSSSGSTGPVIPDCCTECLFIEWANASGGDPDVPGTTLHTSNTQNLSCAFYTDAATLGCDDTCDTGEENWIRVFLTCEDVSDSAGSSSTEDCPPFNKLERWTIQILTGCTVGGCPNNDGNVLKGNSGLQVFYFCCGDPVVMCIDVYNCVSPDFLGLCPPDTASTKCRVCISVDKEPVPEVGPSSSSYDGCPCVEFECTPFTMMPLPEIPQDLTPAEIAQQKRNNRLWGSKPKPAPSRYTNSEDVAKVRDMLGPGPGTELHKIIPKFLESTGCGCRDMAKKMNFWGPDKCDLNREYIVDYLAKKGKEVKLFGWVPQVMMREVADRMLSMAIERARQKETEDWFVAVTTAPREIPTITSCLESLVVAGFNPYIFAEPDTNGLDLTTYGERVIQNEERKGVWRNWTHSARYAIENSDADVIMTVQDDSLFHPDSKTFAESILWPAKDVGFVSLYTPKHYSFRPKDKHELRAPGVNRIYTRSLWGACALVWPRKVLEEVLQDDIIYTWLGAPTRTKSIWEKKKEERRNDPTQIQNSDTAIGKIMNKMKRSMYFVDPSPVNHFATTSTTGHGGNRGRRNCHRCAKFATPLDRQVPLMNNEQELFRISYKDIEI